MRKFMAGFVLPVCLFVSGCSKTPEPIPVATAPTPTPAPRAVPTPEPIVVYQQPEPPQRMFDPPASTTADPTPQAVPSATNSSPRQSASQANRTSNTASRRIARNPSPTSRPREVVVYRRTAPFEDIKNEVNLIGNQIENSDSKYELQRIAATCSRLANGVPQRPDVISVRPPRNSVDRLVSAYQTLAEAAQRKSYYVDARVIPIDQQTREATESARGYVLGAIADLAVAPVQ